MSIPRKHTRFRPLTARSWGLLLCTFLGQGWSGCGRGTETTSGQGGSPGAGSQPPSVLLAPSVASSVRSAVAPNTPFAWRDASHYEFALTLANRTTLGMGVIADFKLQAGLEVTARRVEDDTELAIRINKPRFEVPEEVRKNFEALGAELQVPMLVRLKEGHLVEHLFSPGASAFAVSLVRTVVAALQVAPPPDARATDWTATEEDASGRYSASYQRAGGTALSKRKVSYESLVLGTLGSDQRKASVVPKVVKSEGGVDVDASGLSEAHYDEQLSIDSFPGTPALAHTTLSLRRQSVAAAVQKVDWVALRDQSTPVQLVKSDTHSRAVDPRLDAERIGDFTYETALGALVAQHADPHRDQIVSTAGGTPLSQDEQTERRERLERQGRVFAAMAAILRQQPATVVRAGKAIEARHAARSTLLDALSAAGTKEAQAELVRLMNLSALGEGMQRSVAFSLIRTKAPTPETIEALTAHLSGGPLQRHALYGLGTLARMLSESGQTERATAIARVLVEQLAAATTPAHQVDILRSIANTASSALFSSVEPLLKSSTAKVRAAAVESLRLMQHPGVDEIIAERLLNDDDRSVQMAAVDAIAIRTPTDVLVTALTRTIGAKVKNAVKLKAIDVMGAWAQTRPDLRSELERIASEADEPTIRGAARRALAS